MSDRTGQKRCRVKKVEDVLTCIGFYEMCDEKKDIITETLFLCKVT